MLADRTVRATKRSPLGRPLPHLHCTNEGLEAALSVNITYWRAAIDSQIARRAPRASILQSLPEPGILVPGGNVVRGIQVTGTFRQGDGVPQPSPDIRTH